MLTDQTFVAPPLFAVGPELFYDEGPLGFNIENAIKFRDHYVTCQAFRFAFVGLRDSRRYNVESLLRDVRDVGVPFWKSLVLNSYVRVEQDALKKFSSLCDFFYSPEVSNRITLPKCPMVASPTQIIAVLDWAAVQLSPVTPETFTARLK
jgi:hypothetical protein